MSSGLKFQLIPFSHLPTFDKLNKKGLQTLPKNKRIFAYLSWSLSMFMESSDYKGLQNL